MKNNYTSIILAALHAIAGLFASSYGLIFDKSWIDDIFILYFVLLVLSWTLFKGECVISYIYNLYKNPNYKVGEDATASDILELFGNNKTVYFIFSIFIAILTVASNIILLFRNGYPKYILYSSILLFLLYIAMLKMIQSPLSSSAFFIVNEVVKYSFLLILLYVIHKIYKKYKK
jgi:hypothetical protein